MPVLDDTTKLTLKDLPYIRMAMINVSSHWYNIGIHVGIPTGTLDKFRSKNRNDPDNCLTCVLAEWLKNCSERWGPPTWRKVIIAVSSRVGGDHPAQACKIAKEYKEYGSMNSFKDSDSVDNRPLTSASEMYVVAALLNGVATNWVSVGLFLGIPYKLIEIFKLEDSLEESITKMVDAWLSRKYDVEVFGEPTWRKLAEAVASRSGGCHLRLAAEIARDHPLCYTAAGAEPPSVEQSRVQPHSTAPAPSGPYPLSLNPEVLTERDLSTLMRVLDPVAYKWDVLCLQLGVPEGDLKNIAANAMRIPGAPKTFLQDAIYTWLQQQNDQCTISSLCTALRSDVVDENVWSHEVEVKLKVHKGHLL